jgi:site-specific DNA-cytosine methylase
MQALRDELERLSGKKYFLYHYKHNGLGVGGAAIRARYFFVASQVPFGVTPNEPERVPSILESIGDLANLQLQWRAQSYNRPATWWSHEYRAESGMVDGHITRDSMHARRMDDLLDNVFWEPGKDEAWAIQETWNKLEKRLPESFSGIAERVEGRLREADELDTPVRLGFNGTTRWRPTHPSFVTTGDAGNKIIHPTKSRLLTLRELFRLQSFPDNWKLGELRNDSKVWQYPGKGVSVKVGEHFTREVANALDGNPGEDRGVEIGDREYLIDHSKAHKPALAKLLEETTGV